MARGIVRIEGFQELLRKNQNLSMELAAVNRSIVIKEAENIKRVMIAKAPKKTGLLVRNIGIRIWKDTAGVTGIVIGVQGGKKEPVEEFRVGKDKKAYYPASQEYGWEYPKGTYHPPQPYIRPSFDENKNAIRNNLKKAYKQVIERAGK